MKPVKQHPIPSRQAVDPRYDRRSINIKARYLKNLVLAFLAEVETLGADGHLEFGHGLNLREEVHRFEVDLIKYALQRTSGNQTRAAVLLGVKATTLNSKVKLYHLQTKVVRCVAEHESAVLTVSTRTRPILASDVIAEDQGGDYR